MHKIGNIFCFLMDGDVMTYTGITLNMQWPKLHVSMISYIQGVWISSFTNYYIFAGRCRVLLGGVGKY